MKMYFLLIIITITLSFSLFLLPGCAGQGEGGEQALPNTPETVVRAYQKYVDKNNFEDAKQLSTNAQSEELDMIAELIADDPVDSTIMNTVFLELVCHEREKKATCIYLIQDFGENKDSFNLVNIQGQWFIDTLSSVFTIESDVLFEEIIEQLKKEDFLQVDNEIKK